MSGKNQSPFTFNWQSTAPYPFAPAQGSNFSGTPPSGNATGTMSGTNVIYTNVVDVSRMDNIGIEVAWTGTPTGTIEVLCSNSGKNFDALTFNPVLAQPAGAAGGYLINLNQLPFRYVMLRYTNASGSGTIQAFCQQKDLN